MSNARFGLPMADEIMPGLLLGRAEVDEDNSPEHCVDIVIRLTYGAMQFSNIWLRPTVAKIEYTDVMDIFTEEVILAKEKTLLIHHVKIAEVPGMITKELLDSVYQIINQNVASEKKVLVHCIVNRQTDAARGTAFVTAYLMRQYEFSLQEACQRVQSKNLIVDISAFLPVLRIYENLWPNSVVKVYTLFQTAVDVYQNAKQSPSLDPVAAGILTVTVLDAISANKIDKLFENPESFKLPIFIFQQVKGDLNKLKNDLQRLKARENGQFISVLAHFLTVDKMPAYGQEGPQRLLDGLEYELQTIAGKNVDDEQKKALALKLINQDTVNKLRKDDVTEFLTWFRAETEPNKSLAYIKKETGGLSYWREYGVTRTFQKIEKLLLTKVPADTRSLSSQK